MVLKNFITRGRAFFSSKDSFAKPKSADQMEWSIGIYTGESPFTLLSPTHLGNPILTRNDIFDRDAAFVADPFMIEADGAWYMFFEVFDRNADKGEIGVARSTDGFHWKYDRIVLAEGFHLSYPYVFRWMNNFYMIPESCQARAIRLYRAASFPTQWEFVATLLEGSDYVDPSILRFGDKWWLFASVGKPPYRAENLHLFYSEEILGPWHEHPRSPVVLMDPRMARPAGRLVEVNEIPVRYAQDCYPVYGSRVRAFEIEKLTITDYKEREIDENPILAGTGKGWNESGMHHIDAHPMHDGSWLACVDGWFYRRADEG